MNLVVSGLGSNVDLRARAAAELGRICAGLHLEFQDGFSGDSNGVLIDCKIVIVHPV
jgi:hypothetical protein